MSHINDDLISRFPLLCQEPLGYYPDMLVYQHDSRQYEALWQELSQSPYIYSDGYDLKPAGYLRYGFEVFKGWFGLTNHCQENIVQLSLQKFAYYGYLNGFSQNTLASMQNCPLPLGYRNMVTQPLSDLTSRDLQARLIDYYVEHSEHFPTTKYFNKISRKSVFGDTFFQLGFPQEIPRLDPQHTGLITNTLKKLELGYPPHSYSFVRGSQYARNVASHYLAKAKIEKQGQFYNWPLLSDGQIKAQRYLERALFFDPFIRVFDKPVYIDYYLEKKNLKEAISLIKELENIEQAMAYITNTEHFSKEQQKQCIEKDSRLGIELAKYYLSLGNTIENIQIASEFDSNLAEHDPANSFKLMVADNHLENAWKLFSEKKATVKFATTDLQITANYYNQLGDKHYQEGKLCRDTSDWSKAKCSYLKSLDCKQKAFELEPVPIRQEQVFTHKRLMAQVIFDADIQTNDKQHCEIKQIKKYIKLLETCQSEVPNERKYHKDALIKGLMREIDYMTYLISVPSQFEGDPDKKNQHMLNHQENFKVTLLALERVVSLLNGTSDPEHKRILGKAYFLLGDINMFFDFPSNHKEYFLKAMQTVPANPFYLLRCSEMFELQKDKLRQQAIPLLKEFGYTVMDWYHWDKDRWEKNDVNLNTIKDIHCMAETAPKAWYSFSS